MNTAPSSLLEKGGWEAWEREATGRWGEAPTPYLHKQKPPVLLVHGCVFRGAPNTA